MLFLYFLIAFALGQEPEMQADETIVVEAHRDFEVYVAPTVMDIQSTEVEAVMAKKTVFSYASRYASGAKVRNARDTGYENVNINHKIKVYDEDFDLSKMVL